MALKKTTAAKSKASSPKHTGRARSAAASKTSAAARKGPKTVATTAPVSSFISTLDAPTREACALLDRWMQKATGGPGVMYGTAIAGYGSKTIVYAGGREAPWMKLGFSPRKNALTLYGVLSAAPAGLLRELGKHSTGKGCLYIKDLGEVNTEVLRKMIEIAARA
jgi:hypothetical protein